MSRSSLAGKFGEIRAAEYLEQNGYTILRRNFKNNISEIDIVAMDGDVMCFVEVKTRKSKGFGRGADAVDRAKREKMILGARSYVSKYRPDNPLRFDVVEVYGEMLPGGFRVSEINLIKNAFYV